VKLTWTDENESTDGLFRINAVVDDQGGVEWIVSRDPFRTAPWRPCDSLEEAQAQAQAIADEKLDEFEYPRSIRLERRRAVRILAEHDAAEARLAELRAFVAAHPEDDVS